MKRNWIRYGLIVFTMLLCICFTAISTAEELPASATNLLLNVETIATITADQLTWFRFSPTQTAAFSFCSSSDEDTYGYLYEKTGENEITQIGYNDDGGEGNNFLIKRMLTQGKEYYFAVRFYNPSNSGSFPVKIEEFTGLCVSPVGETNITTDFGNTVQLAVEAFSQKGTVTYQWLSEDQNGSWTEIEGKTSATFSTIATVGQSRYICSVTDGVTSDSISFYVLGNDALTATVEGSTSTSTSIYPVPNSSVEMKVEASSTSGTVNYKWYKSWYDESDSYHEDEINGADSATYTEGNIDRNCTYRCSVSSLTQSQSIHFNVYINNSLTAVVAGKTESSDYRTVDPGESVTMKVTATATNMEGITYRWQKCTRNSNGYGSWQDIPDVTGNELTENVTTATEYHCYVTDIYGNNATVWFNIGIDNHLTVTVDGKTVTQDYLSVAPNESVTMKVAVTATNMEGITYRWEKCTRGSNGYGNWQDIPDVTGNELTENVTTATEYHCYVTDIYGNNETVSFNIRIDNHLTVTVDGKTVTQDYLSVAPNESVSMKVAVTATNMEGITYRWQKFTRDGNGYLVSQAISGVTGNELTETVTEYTEYYCNVADVYGNSASVWFYVGIDNHLTVTVDGKTVTQDYLSVAPNESVSMKVAVTATNMEGITYRWQKSTRDGNGYLVSQAISGVTGNELTETVTEYTEYYCNVADVYGNSASVWFYVGIDNHLTVTVDGKTTAEDSLSVAPGENVTLKVAATATNMEGITYRWEKYTRDSNGNGNWTTVNDAAGSELTATIISYSEYECTVQDIYGNASSVRFYVQIDNQLTVTIAGTAETYERRKVAYGGCTTLKLDVSAANMGGITYSWSKMSKDINGYETWREVSGVTGNELTTEAITAYTGYQCCVRDAYGNSRYVSIYIGVDNGLKALPVGDAAPVVHPGDILTLQVSATVNSGAIHYQWHREYRTVNGVWMTDYFEEATGATYTTEVINRSMTYYCTVTDDFNNSETVSFSVGIDNGLTVNAAGNGNTSIAVNYGSTATIGVIASVYTGDIHYQWYKREAMDYGWSYNQVVGATNATYTTAALDQAENYYCRVTDDYGNSRQIYFTIGIENHLTVTAEDMTGYGNTKTITVQPGESSSLKVIASADNMTGITYQWYRGVWDEESYGWDNYQMPGETSDSLAVSNITERKMFRCEVKDLYGNSKSFYFYLEIDNQLFATMAEGTVLTVNPGSNTTLAVTASCATGSIKFQWFKQTVNEYGYNTRVMIPSATTASYTTDNLNARTVYFCEVMDDYNNSRTVQFSVGIENRIKVSSSGNISVPKGQDAELEVQAICRSGSLSYEWYINDVKDSSASGSVYIVRNVTTYVDVRCVITDMYGNNRTVWFGVSVDNNLSTNLTAAVNGVPTEITRDSNWNYILDVAPESQITVTCNASCKEGSPQYRWEDGDTGETISTGNTISISQARYRFLTCNVTDMFGNSSWERIWINVENEFSVEREGQMFRTVQEGSSVTLKVNASAKEGILEYKWYGNNGTLENATTNQITVTASRNETYTCLVTDIYGNYRGVQFYVVVNTPELQLGQMTRVNLVSGENKFYVFTPSESGSYTIVSYGSDADTYVTLYNNNGQIASNDDGGEGVNFKLTAELEAGTEYRFMVREYNYNSASFSMKLVKDSEETIVETFSGYVLRTGQTARLPISVAATATSSDPSVISVNGMTITAKKEGTARIIVMTTEENYEIQYDISVQSGAVLNLPAGLMSIETEAFAGDNSIRFVNLNSNTKYVGPFAFDESGLVQLYVPAADIRIAFSALNDTRATILCPENSLAAEMAMRFGYRFLYLP